MTPQPSAAGATGSASPTGSAPKVWFITGASRGFGRVWTEAALQRGDKVAATARQLASLADLAEQYGPNVLALELDVTNPEQVKTAVTRAHEHFGRLDVVLNNAGYSLVGTIEEASLDDVRALYETNVYGSVAVIQAALPLLRRRAAGTSWAFRAAWATTRCRLSATTAPRSGPLRRCTKAWPPK